MEVVSKTEEEENKEVGAPRETKHILANTSLICRAVSKGNTKAIMYIYSAKSVLQSKHYRDQVVVESVGVLSGSRVGGKSNSFRRSPK
jgi:hypothetical protein